MKKQLSLIILFIGLLFSFHTQAQNLPDYDDVVRKFFKEYSTYQIRNSGTMVFEKRPEGWFVSTINYTSNGATYESEPYYLKSAKKYLKLKFPKKREDESGFYEEQTFLKAYSRNYFSISPYYGYKGWSMDMIKDYTGRKNISQDELYMLGRAYSEYASNLLNNNSGYADSTLMFKTDHLNEAQMAEYRIYRHLAKSLFDSLAKINPAYPTIVGEINVKADNENITSYLDIFMYVNHEEALKEIPDNLYSEFLKNIARNMLMTCDSNAILITNGDNDTYPLLYIQEKEHYRTDVLVINISLLNTQPYIHFLTDSKNFKNPLPISMDESEYRTGVKDYVLIKNNEDKFISIPEALKTIRTKANISGSGFIYLDSQKFTLDGPANSGEKLFWKLKVEYIDKASIILIDFLATNNWQRPLYFAMTVDTDYMLGLQDYFRMEGLASKLVPQKNPDPESSVEYANTSKMYALLTHDFIWDGLTTMSPRLRNLGTNYRHAFNQLALNLIEENKKDSAYIISKRNIELLNDDLLYFNIFNIPTIESFLKTGNQKEAIFIAKKISVNLKTGRDINLDNKATVSTPFKNKQIIEAIRDLGSKYHVEELEKLDLN